MRRHNLLLSLLALLFAVFMTACDNGTTNNAKAPIGDGGDQGGGAITPTLSISYEIDKVNYKKVYFTGRLENANEEDYNFTWSFGDDEVSPDSPLVIDHTYLIDKGYGVTLAATPKDPEKTPAIANAITTVTISQSGIHIQTLRYSALSGMEYEFQAIATTTDGSPVRYTWDFGDGTVVEDTLQNAMTHRYTKYNTEYTVKVSAKKENAGNTGSVEFPEVKVRTPGITAQMTVENDPDNKALKRMSVNFYDETGALIHGSSDGTGEVTGLDNVTYKWDFDNDTNIDKTTNVRYTEHTYSASSGVYTIKMTATSDTYTGTVEATGEANVELTYALPTLNARFTDAYGLQLQVDVSGNGGAAFNGGSAWYEVVFPDGVSQGETVTHNTDGTVSKTFTRTLPAYYSNYNITVNVRESEHATKVLATRSVTIERPSFRYTLEGPNNGDSYFNKSFSVTPERDSFTLKDATFDWNFGEGSSVRAGANANYTYSGSGEKTVTVTIGSELLRNSGISVAVPTKTFTINADITINRIECPNHGADRNFLQYDCRVYLTSSNNLPLYYKWYKGGQLVPNCEGPYCEHTFDVYNKGYTVKVEVGPQGISSQPKSITSNITTPNVTAVLDGPRSTIHAQSNRYTVTTKVRHNGAEKTITLNNPTYAFKLRENSNGQTGNSSTWDVAFEPDPRDYQGDTVTRTVYVNVTAQNLAQKVTSNDIATSVRKQSATLESFNTPVITCSPASSINQIRQKCKMTMTAKNNVGTVTGNFDEYTAKFTYKNTSQTLKFNSLPITSGAKGTTNEFTIDFNWPSSGEYTTGSTPTTSYVVGGEVYKTNDANKKSPAQQVNINIRLDVDYALYPLVDRNYPLTRGGSGYKFGTWSCGHNEVRGENNIGSGGAKCASNNSVTRQTLKLGVFGNGNTLKETLTFKWKMKVSNISGFANKGDITIHEFTVNKGQTIGDNNLSFNIAKKLNDNNVKFTGSVFGNGNLFYLEISSGNPDTLAKPVKVWYNGSNKTGNRLRKISPMMETDGYNKCSIKYVQGGNGFPSINVTFHVTEAKLLFSYADKNGGIKSLLPDGNNKPFFRFYNKACGSNTVCNETNNDLKDTRNEDATDTEYTGWYFRDGSYGTADKKVLSNKVNLSDSFSSGSSTMKVVFKDMLTGGEITDYYKEERCN